MNLINETTYILGNGRDLTWNRIHVFTILVNRKIDSPTISLSSKIQLKSRAIALPCTSIDPENDKQRSEGERGSNTM